MLSIDTKAIYVASSFLAGFSIMVVELISSRIVAPIIGASVFTWTSVIGLTLLGLAIGGWAGGRIADTVKSHRPLPVAFLLSAVSIALIPKLAEHTYLITNISNSILTLNLVLSLYLFLIPACMVGMIQPLILKKYADEFSCIGTKYGTLSAAWSVGSMIGVFLTGFYFISNIGSSETIWVVATLLFVLGMTFAISDKQLLIVFLIVLCGTTLTILSSRAVVNKNVLFETETDYYSAKVVDTTLPGFGKSRVLLLDIDVHSIDTPPSHILTYTNIQHVFSYLKDDIHDILVLGGGAYTIPKHLRDYYKDSQVTVVETDPEMVPIANRYFNLAEYDIQTVIGDARLLVQKDTKTYDLIFGDAYNSYISVPWYLLTQEWNDRVRARLNINGIYAINLIGPLSGADSAFAQSVISTFKRSFPNYYVFAFGVNPAETQNMVLVGINGKLPLTEEELVAKLRTNERYAHFARMVTPRDTVSDNLAVILTDNFSPIEHLMSPTIKKYLPGNISFLRNHGLMDVN